MEELTAAGCKFPVKVYMRYNPDTTNWDKECQVVEQQLENALGKDYIDVIVEAGPSTGFLGAVRRTGDFGLMKCNWGADYADPQTWTDPFSKTNTYNFMNQDASPLCGRRGLRPQGRGDPGHRGGILPPGGCREGHHHR